MTTEELVSFDVLRISNLDIEEYEYLKKHPYSKKLREECNFVNMNEMDYGLVGNYIRTMKIRGYDTAIYKDELLYGFYERNNGLITTIIRDSLEEKYGKIKPYKMFPINAKVEQLLNSLYIDTHAEPNSIVCIVFEYTEKYVLAED